MPFRILERADDELERRQNQKHQGKNEKRRNAEPAQGKAKPLRCSRFCLAPLVSHDAA
jgi:hypothetical protein